MKEDFMDYEKILKKVNPKLKTAFMAFSISAVADMRESDGPLAFLLLNMLKENNELNEEILELKRSYSILMSLYADNNS